MHLSFNIHQLCLQVNLSKLNRGIDNCSIWPFYTTYIGVHEVLSTDEQPNFVIPYLAASHSYFHC